jgi:Cu/Zn superoxide dismutase
MVAIGVQFIPTGGKSISTSATFPASLYTTDATIEDNTLTRDEWQQVTVEVEAVEKGLMVSTAAGGSTAGLYGIKFIQGGSTATGGLMLYVDSAGYLTWRSSADVTFRLAPPS